MIVPLLVFNAPTIATGRIYERTPDVEEMVQKLKDKQLYVELGTPAIDSRMSAEERLQRLYRIEFSQVCGTLSRITLEGDTLMGKFAAAGPLGAQFVESRYLENGRAYLALRGVGSNHVFRDKRAVFILRTIITFDMVLRPDGKLP